MFEIHNRRYIGSKYKLMSWIKELIDTNCTGETFFDVFAGTGTVTNYLSEDYNNFIINDFLYSNEVIYKGFFLQNDYDITKLNSIGAAYNSKDKSKIRSNYVSKNFGDKFFRMEDAKLIGFIREDINKKYENKEISEKEYYILLSSLIYSLDRIANTVGHYDAYFKGKEIKGNFTFDLISPKKLKDNQSITFYRKDANELVKSVKADIAFIDPPYNSRQYSRFYHVLENIIKWKKPKLYGVAMKPEEENMSDYCKSSAPIKFKELIDCLNVKYIVVTYNNTYNSKSSSSKNKITLEEITEILKEKGTVQTFEKVHQFFNAGKTNFNDHKEYVFICKAGDKKNEE